jgi:hypothetical protein
MMEIDFTSEMHPGALLSLGAVMQNKMMQMLSNIGLRALEISRAYYFPPPMTDMAGSELLSEAEYVDLLQEIDKFSAQFPLSNKNINAVTYNSVPQVL